MLWHKQRFGKSQCSNVENGVPIMNFKRFILDNAHANWIVVHKVHGGGNPTLPYRGTQKTLVYFVVCKPRKNHVKTYLACLCNTNTNTCGNNIETPNI